MRKEIKFIIGFKKNRSTFIQKVEVSHEPKKREINGYIEDDDLRDLLTFENHGIGKVGIEKMNGKLLGIF